ncbi:hypothetical protein B0T20DRAFT_391237 [Sordaria brevicollis]|uniref:Uncharacterized protein n=1 Tax=Sordaria brevicollis TaxID=83679 RepID=A0AAE0PGZ2_SORBR|nr:hypothetical protein B0T20DRAFT_391237 [Sordaria brevicollis]
MEQNDNSAPMKRFITSAAQFHRLQEEARAAALLSANSARCADFPANDNNALIALVDEALDAINNIHGVLDNVGDNPNENSDIRAIRNMARDRQEQLVWAALFKCRDIQLGIRNPDVYAPEFPNFMSRWKAFVSFLRSSKAGAADLFAPSYMDRYVSNPVKELDVRLPLPMPRLCAGKQLKPYNIDIKAARDNGRIVTQNEHGAEIRDATGALIKTLVRPQKRDLNEFLDEDLPAQVKRPKKGPNTRPSAGTSAGSPAASGMSAATTGTGEHVSQAMTVNPLPVVQEEEEMPDTPQPSSSRAPIYTGLLNVTSSQPIADPSTTQHTILPFEADQQDHHVPNSTSSQGDYGHQTNLSHSPNPSSHEQPNIQTGYIEEPIAEHNHAGPHGVNAELDIYDDLNTSLPQYPSPDSYYPANQKP